MLVQEEVMKASGTKDEISLDQIKLDLDKTKEDLIANDQTLEDLVSHPQTWRSRKKDAAAKYEDNSGFMSARSSFKVFPESSMPATARVQR